VDCVNCGYTKHTQTFAFFIAKNSSLFEENLVTNAGSNATFVFPETEGDAGF